MIDVHVLVHSGTRAEWLEQCLASLDQEGVTVHVVRGVEGSVGAGRYEGYQLGTHDWVSFVDSDDYILPGAIAACIAGMEKYHAVTTLEYAEDEAGHRFPWPRPNHNMTVYRRADILPLLELIRISPHCGDVWLRRLIKPRQLDFIGYVWRVHSGGDHKNAVITAMHEEGVPWRTLMERQ